ncbi:MAG: biotin transporter BioY [Thermoprotei archaeon]|nr:MAG: biotin transporter BioY [Thermoprotei archaeon]
MMLSGLLLSPRYACISQLLYLLLIMIGAPLAAGFKGGMGVLVGPTAGYLWAFPIVSYMVSIFARPILRRGYKVRSWGVCTLVSIFIYAIGASWLILWLKWLDGGIKIWAYNVARLLGIPSNDVLVAFFVGVLIFLPQDILVDHVLAVVVAYKIIRRSS